MLVPCSIFELEPWDYVKSVQTTSSMIHLLPEPKPPLLHCSELIPACLWEIANRQRLGFKMLRYVLK